MVRRYTGDVPGRPTITALRLGFTAVAVLALIFGYAGLGAYLTGAHAPEDFGSRPIDLFYYDLQLFVLGADPLQAKGPYPAELEIARFAAPAATLYALFGITFRLFASEFQRFRARMARGHVIVCGDGPIAETLTSRLRAAGESVVSVRHPAEPLSLLPGDLLTVFGDASRPEVLRAAGVGRATALYACGGEASAANAVVALAAAAARSATDEALPVYVHIPDPDLCLTLQARYLGVDHPPRLQLDFFNIDDVAARMLFVTEPLRPVGGRPPRITVVGATPFGRAVVVEAARSWRAGDPMSLDRLPVTVVDREATTAVDDLVRRYPFLRTVCRLTPYDADLARSLVDGRLREPPGRAFICHENEDEALRTATAADRFWRGAPQSIIVRLDRLAVFSVDDGDGPGGRLFNEVNGKVRAFGVVSTACRPELIGDDLVGRIARSIHERYRLARYREGALPATTPSMVAWEELPEHLKESNRRQARDIGRKLGEIHCVLIPRVGQDDDGVLSDSEVERLARMEHGRWYDDRRADGWRYSGDPDPHHRLHPAVRPWDELPQQLRERNHTIVRDLPAVLSDAGFQIVHR